jgi:DNA-directed RNA polymerase subunit N (RpoN/RPB10)
MEVDVYDEYDALLSEDVDMEEIVKRLEIEQAATVIPVRTFSCNPLQQSNSVGLIT